MTDVDSIQRSDNAYRAIRDRILDGTLPPEAPLRLRNLCTTLGISATPIRESLNRLQGEYLVTAEANKGFRVAPVTIAELLDLEHARARIETQLLAEAIEAGDGQWESAIVGAHYRLSRAPSPMGTSSAEDLAQWEAAHAAFHQALVAAAPSVWLHRFSAQVADQLKRYYRYILFQRDAWARYTALHGEGAFEALFANVLGPDHHARLMQAVLDRDKSGADALMIEHVQLVVDAFLAMSEFAGARLKREAA